MTLEVTVDREVEGEAAALGPTHEAALPVVPPRRRAPHRVLVRLEIVEEPLVARVAVGFDGRDPTVVGLVGSSEKPPLDRTQERDLRSPRVQTFAAPLV